jgi:hypothetical protein
MTGSGQPVLMAERGSLAMSPVRGCAILARKQFGQIVDRQKCLGKILIAEIDAAGLTQEMGGRS